jgi:hypothetical protein
MHAGDQSQSPAFLHEIRHFAIMHTYAGSIHFVQFWPALSTFGHLNPIAAAGAPREKLFRDRAGFGRGERRFSIIVRVAISLA